MQYNEYYPRDVLLRFVTHPEEMKNATAPFEEKDVLYRLTQTVEERTARKSGVDEFVIVRDPLNKGMLRLWAGNHAEEMWICDIMGAFGSRFIQYSLGINLEE